MEYKELLRQKALIKQSDGRVADESELNPVLMPLQRVGTLFALRKGRAALFFDTGLGKTLSQLEWGRLIGGRGLIIAPLSVARQTVREGKTRLDMDVHFTGSSNDLSDTMNITNYEMLHHFDPSLFSWVVLDESSILKSIDGKTRRLLTDMFSNTPYRLCCSATPAPNDVAEIGRHSEFLGIMRDKEMLSAFFINDMEKSWRLKKHAVQPFYRWMASWAMAVRKPSDVGLSDGGYELPPLNISPLYTHVDYVPEGQLFFTGLKGVGDRSKVRKATIADRVNETANLVNASNEQWIIWCGLNDEADALAKAIPGAVNVEGSMPTDVKTAYIEAFQDGDIRVMVSKPKIAGMGMNFQNCHNMAFVGLNDSWEQYYQSIRRCYRFGQTSEVNVHIVLSDIEDEIYQNIINKERESAQLMEQLVKAMRGYTLDELQGVQKKFEYATDHAEGENWRLFLGDSCELMPGIDENVVDLSIHSPPFISLYTYSPTERDLGNSRDKKEFFAQYRLIIDELYRITKPGRNACVHVQQVGATLGNDGFIGIKDFRGDVIRAFTEHVITRDMTDEEVEAEMQRPLWTLHGEVTVDKNPQIQAIRKKVKGLMFAQLEKDSVANRPAFADYILIFQKPGKNAVPVKPQATREEWIQWAHPVWYDISETDVLNTQLAKDNSDERHIAPLQLKLIERCIRLWSNEGETVFDPFNGIGSTGHEAVRLGRHYVGCELKPSYFKTSIQNLQNAERMKSLDLFEWAAQQQEYKEHQEAVKAQSDAEWAEVFENDPLF